MAGERITSISNEDTQKRNYAADRGLEAWKNWNKLTMIGSLGVGLFIPPVALLAAVDGVQIMAINEIQKRRRAKTAETVVFDAHTGSKKQYRKAA